MFREVLFILGLFTLASCHESSLETKPLDDKNKHFEFKCNDFNYLSDSTVYAFLNSVVPLGQNISLNEDIIPAKGFFFAMQKEGFYYDQVIPVFEADVLENGLCVTYNCSFYAPNPCSQYKYFKNENNVKYQLQKSNGKKWCLEQLRFSKSGSLALKARDEHLIPYAYNEPEAQAPVYFNNDLKTGQHTTKVSMSVPIFNETYDLALLFLCYEDFEGKEKKISNYYTYSSSGWLKQCTYFHD